MRFLPVIVATIAPLSFAAPAIFEGNFSFLACEYRGSLNDGTVFTTPDGTLKTGYEITAPAEGLNLSRSSDGIITQHFKNGSNGTLVLSSIDGTLSIKKSQPNSTDIYTHWTLDHRHRLGLKQVRARLVPCMSATTGQYTTVKLGYGSFQPTCGPGEVYIDMPAVVRAPVAPTGPQIAQTCWNSFPES